MWTACGQSEMRFPTRRYYTALCIVPYINFYSVSCIRDDLTGPCTYSVCQCLANQLKIIKNVHIGLRQWINLPCYPAVAHVSVSIDWSLVDVMTCFLRYLDRGHCWLRCILRYLSEVISFGVHCLHDVSHAPRIACHMLCPYLTTRLLQCGAWDRERPKRFCRKYRCF